MDNTPGVTVKTFWKLVNVGTSGVFDECATLDHIWKKAATTVSGYNFANCWLIFKIRSGKSLVMIASSNSLTKRCVTMTTARNSPNDRLYIAAATKKKNVTIIHTWCSSGHQMAGHKWWIIHHVWQWKHFENWSDVGTVTEKNMF